VGATVLLIEDEPKIRELLRSYLERDGLEVVSTGSGAEAITINGERLVSTSSIYGVGSSILVNTAFLSPTFRIEAIGSNERSQATMRKLASTGTVKMK